MTDALADETSPYLLQHAHNPVDWRPWSEAAFAAAKEEDKLVFLSVGYSTCHWCHVMERESFENEAIAAVMNANFICVKVDREERPDIDATYMAFCSICRWAAGAARRNSRGRWCRGCCCYWRSASAARRRRRVCR